MKLASMALLGACLTAAALLQVPSAQAQDARNEGMPPDTQVVAEVNGSKVLFRDVRLAYENLPQQYRGLPLEQLYQPLVQQLTERRLVLMAAIAEKLADDPEVASRIIQARDRILEQAYVSNRISAAATEEALRARYEAEKGQQKGPDEVRASHILVETKEEAEALIAELDKGADFAELAKKNSKGPSGAQGGDLGYFTQDRMVPEFADAAFAMKAGEVSAPVKTGFGWHVIKVVDRRQGEGPTFAERAPELRQAMAQTVVAGVLAELGKDAEIKIFGLDGSLKESAAESSTKQ